MIFSIFLLVKAHQRWLLLSRQQRAEMFQQHVAVHFGGDSNLRMRFFDAEAFHGKLSDIMMIETEDLRASYYFIETLRDSPIFQQAYFELVDVIPAIENGFQQYEAQLVAKA